VVSASIGFPSPTLLVYYKRRRPRLLRPLHRLQDTVDAIVDDGIGRWPALGPVVRSHRIPSL
jgi:hypothetical protein